MPRVDLIPSTRILRAGFICNIMLRGDLIATTRILGADFICNIMPWGTLYPPQGYCGG
jgi:hypothetical protein